LFWRKFKGQVHSLLARFSVKDIQANWRALELLWLERQAGVSGGTGVNQLD
jgi:hypothetical protein